MKCSLTPEQKAPYSALCGAKLTITSEASPYCGQSGRVCRVFWRQDEVWVLVRCQRGGLTALPWNWTDLPKLKASDSKDQLAVLLSGAVLRDLLRFLQAK